MDIHDTRVVPNVRDAFVTDPVSGDVKDTMVAGLIIDGVDVRDLMQAHEAAGRCGGSNG